MKILVLFLFQFYFQNIKLRFTKYIIFEMAAAQRRHVVRERNEIGLKILLDSLRHIKLSQGTLKEHHFIWRALSV